MSTYCISCNKSPLDPSKDGLNMCASCLKAEKQRAIATEPAFPIDLGIAKAYGLTKREWFAGMALQGMMSNHIPESQTEKWYMATHSFAMADAVLKEGAK